MIVAVSMFRDEQDIAAWTLMHLFAEGVDHVIVADNLSQDNTRQILDAIATTFPLTVVDDTEIAYFQAEKMTRLAHQAGEMGAEWVLPFDADEMWYSETGTVADTLADVSGDVVKAWGWDHVPQRSDPDAPNPFCRITHRRQNPQRLPKVAFRYHPDARLHMGNHDVDRAGTRVTALAYRHFGYRSYAQMRRKLRNGREAYEATDLHPTYGTHWREGGAKPDDVLLKEWEQLLDEPGLIYDPAPVRA